MVIECAEDCQKSSSVEVACSTQAWVMKLPHLFFLPTRDSATPRMFLALFQQLGILLGKNSKIGVPYVGELYDKPGAFVCAGHHGHPPDIMQHVGNFESAYIVRDRQENRHAFTCGHEACSCLAEGHAEFSLTGGILLRFMTDNDPVADGPHPPDMWMMEEVIFCGSSPVRLRPRSFAGHVHRCMRMSKFFKPVSKNLPVPYGFNRYTRHPTLRMAANETIGSFPITWLTSLPFFRSFPGKLRLVVSPYHHCLLPSVPLPLPSFILSLAAQRRPSLSMAGRSSRLRARLGRRRSLLIATRGICAGASPDELDPAKSKIFLSGTGIGDWEDGGRRERSPRETGPRPLSKVKVWV
ncbi:hypothetical protein B0H19DRAFT_1233885 [Mycena capillaripes]|nr:hypothetical protein B0H19DRAFT_1233885 [Mycena capillaripes]